MSPTLEDMLLENAKYGWPDPYLDHVKYCIAMGKPAFVAEDIRQWLKRKQLNKYPSLKD